jgi:predicted metalloprotease
VGRQLLRGTEPSSAKQSKAEQSRAEQSRAEQSKAKQSKAKQSKAKQKAKHACVTALQRLWFSVKLAKDQRLQPKITLFKL